MISNILLILGLLIMIVVIVKAIRHQRKQPFFQRGLFAKHALTEAIVYFLCALGFPDFVMNTLVLKRLNWVRLEKLPATLIACSATPGAIIAYAYLNEAGSLEMKTILICMAAIAAGVLTGGQCVGRMQAKLLKTIMAAALTISVAALIIKMILQAGHVGTGNGLTTQQLLIAVPCVFLFGFINMFGVPMKPMATVLFLLLGLSPLNTLTLMLILGCVSPVIGSVKVLRAGVYDESLAVGSVIFGTLGALIGTQLTVQINQTVLNILLILIMCFTVYTLLRKEKNQRHDREAYLNKMRI